MHGNFWILIKKIKYFDNKVFTISRSGFLPANNRTYFQWFHQKRNLLQHYYVIQSIPCKEPKNQLGGTQPGEIPKSLHQMTPTLWATGAWQGGLDRRAHWNICHATCDRTTSQHPTAALRSNASKSRYLAILSSEFLTEASDQQNLGHMSLS